VPAGTRFKIFHYKPWTSVSELMYRLGRMNFKYLFYKKKLCFLHSMLSCKNVDSSVMEVFVRSEEYRKAYDFANVKPCDTKDKITCCLRVKFADSIESDMNVVQ